MIVAMSLFAAIDARLVGALQHARDDERRENAEDHDDDEHLDQREARRAAERAVPQVGRHHRTIIIRRSRVLDASARRRTFDRSRLVPTLPSVARFVAILLALVARGRRCVGVVVARAAAALPSSPFVFDVKSGCELAGGRARPRRRRACCRRSRPLVLPRAVDAASIARSRRATTRSPRASRSPQLLDKLTQGDVTQTALTIVEGSTFGDLVGARRGERRTSRSRRRTLPMPSLMAKLGVPRANRRRLVLSRHLFLRDGIERPRRCSRARTV